MRTCLKHARIIDRTGRPGVDGGPVIEPDSLVHVALPGAGSAPWSRASWPTWSSWTATRSGTSRCCRTGGG